VEEGEGAAKDCAYGDRMEHSRLTLEEYGNGKAS